MDIRFAWWKFFVSRHIRVQASCELGCKYCKAQKKEIPHPVSCNPSKKYFSIKLFRFRKIADYNHCYLYFQDCSPKSQASTSSDMLGESSRKSPSLKTKASSQKTEDTSDDASSTPTNIPNTAICSSYRQVYVSFYLLESIRVKSAHNFSKYLEIIFKFTICRSHVLCLSFVQLFL